MLELKSATNAPDVRKIELHSLSNTCAASARTTTVENPSPVEKHHAPEVTMVMSANCLFNYWFVSCH